MVEVRVHPQHAPEAGAVRGNLVPARAAAPTESPPGAPPGLTSPRTSPEPTLTPPGATSDAGLNGARPGGDVWERGTRQAGYMTVFSILAVALGIMIVAAMAASPLVLDRA